MPALRWPPRGASSRCSLDHWQGARSADVRAVRSGSEARSGTRPDVPRGTRSIARGIDQREVRARSASRGGADGTDRLALEIRPRGPGRRSRDRNLGSQCAAGESHLRSVARTALSRLQHARLARPRRATRVLSSAECSPSRRSRIRRRYRCTSPCWRRDRASRRSRTTRRCSDPDTRSSRSSST